MTSVVTGKIDVRAGWAGGDARYHENRTHGVRSSWCRCGMIERSRRLALGSAGPDLLRQSSETLVGRIETVTLSGFGADALIARSRPRRQGT